MGCFLGKPSKRTITVIDSACIKGIKCGSVIGGIKCGRTCGLKWPENFSEGVHWGSNLQVIT